MGLQCDEAAAQGAEAGGVARESGPGPGLLLQRLLRRRGGRRRARRARGRRGCGARGSRAGRPAARVGLPGWDPPGGTMRVARWLTGLLYQLSLFITRSWEIHFHPRQGRVTAGRLQQRGGGEGPGGTGGRSGVGDSARL